MVNGPDIHKNQYGVVWLIGAVGYRNLTDSTTALLSLAICRKTGEIYTMAMYGTGQINDDSIRCVVVRDLLIEEDGICEDGTRCLNIGCPLNRTTWRTWDWLMLEPTKGWFDRCVKDRKEIQAALASVLPCYLLDPELWHGSIIVFDAPLFMINRLPKKMMP
ncbi:MAG: hypothetical protein WCK39_04675 [Methanomassiliicoccales archaeon]